MGSISKAFSFVIVWLKKINITKLFSSVIFWIVIIIIYTLFWIAFPHLTCYCIRDPEVARDFSTYLEAFAAYFSGLALIGVIATIWMQRELLKIQAKELRIHGEVFEEQATTQAISSILMASTTKIQFGNMQGPPIQTDEIDSYIKYLSEQISKSIDRSKVTKK
ncbi:MAG: hypothetical protein GY855_17810 [candidate division Zixibacteria bacterium]|nr:hypothetical protein [candidate division Zixibacteria bacterium]